jgi:excisionase family DNA binding protein
MKLERDIYTAKEAAALIDLSPQAIRAAIHAGTLKAEKFNTYYIIHRDDLAEYLEYRERRDNGE